MKKVIAKAALAMAALFAVGLLVGLDSGPLQAKQADSDAATQQVKPKRTIRVPGTARSTAKIPAGSIEVTGPRTGTIVRGGFRTVRVIWKYKGSATHADKSEFRVKVMKHSDRSWSVDLGRYHNFYIEALAYGRNWRVPDAFTAGTDYFVRVIHVPSGATSHSGFFTIQDR